MVPVRITAETFHEHALRVVRQSGILVDFSQSDAFDTMTARCLEALPQQAPDCRRRSSIDGRSEASRVDLESSLWSSTQPKAAFDHGNIWVSHSLSTRSVLKVHPVLP